MTDTGSVDGLDRLDALEPTVQDMMTEVLEGQIAMQETLTAILTKFEDLSTEIRPTLDSLTNHPLIKMLSKGNGK